MKKTVFSLIVIAVVMSTICACSAGVSDTHDPNPFQADTPKTSEPIIKDEEIIIDDITVKNNADDNKNEVPRISYSSEPIDVEALKDAVIPHENITVDIREDGTRTFHELSDGSDFFYTRYGLAEYHTAFSESALYVFQPDKTLSWYNADLFNDADLEFESRESVVTKLKELLSRLGIEVYDDYDLYALDHETMNQEQEKVLTIYNPDLVSYAEEGKASIKKEWTKEDECYYIRFKQKIDQLPVNHRTFSYQTREMRIPGTEIVAIYSKNGIQELSLRNILTEGKAITSPEVVLSADDIIANFSTLFENIILAEPLIAESAELVYFPYTNTSDNSIELIPVWTLTCLQKETNVSSEQSIPDYYITYYFDAVTGEQII